MIEVMIKKSVDSIHRLPNDFSKAIMSDEKVKELWEDITPLARNEWICWVISPQKEETRQKHIKRALEELREGKRRPCCWPGCPHRKNEKK